MEKIKTIFNNLKEEDFWDKANFHVHSYFSDGKKSPEYLLEKAKEKGLNHFAICDHNTIDAYLHSNILNDEIVLPAVEFDCWYQGILIHLIGYGIDVNNQKLKQFYAKNKNETQVDIVRFFSYRSVKKLIDAIHEAGGIVSLAHPACCWAICLEHFIKTLVNLGLDAIEVYYPYKRHRGIIKFHSVAKVKKIARNLNLICTGGTDEHGDFLD